MGGGGGGGGVGGGGDSRGRWSLEEIALLVIIRLQWLFAHLQCSFSAFGLLVSGAVFWEGAVATFPRV